MENPSVPHIPSNRTVCEGGIEPEMQHSDLELGRIKVDTRMIVGQAEGNTPAHTTKTWFSEG